MGRKRLYTPAERKTRKTAQSVRVSWKCQCGTLSGIPKCLPGACRRCGQEFICSAQNLSDPKPAEVIISSARHLSDPEPPEAIISSEQNLPVARIWSLTEKATPFKPSSTKLAEAPGEAISSAQNLSDPKPTQQQESETISAVPHLSDSKPVEVDDGIDWPPQQPRSLHPIFWKKAAPFIPSS